MRCRGRVRCAPRFLCVSLLILTVGCGDGERAARLAAARARATRCLGSVEPPVIESARLGPLRIGGTLSGVAERCDVRDSLFASSFRPMPGGREFEGMSEVGRLVDFGTSSVVALLNRGPQALIQRLLVTDPAIRTDREIGPGSTVGEMRRAYGRLCAGQADGVATLLVDSLAGVWFHTSTTLPSVRIGTDIYEAAASIPDTATLRMISIQYSGPSCVGRARASSPAARRLSPDSAARVVSPRDSGDSIGRRPLPAGPPPTGQ